MKLLSGAYSLSNIPIPYVGDYLNGGWQISNFRHKFKGNKLYFKTSTGKLLEQSDLQNSQRNDNDNKRAKKYIQNLSNMHKKYNEAVENMYEAINHVYDSNND